MRRHRARRPSTVALLAAMALGLALSAVLAPHDVAACGGFFSVSEGRKPSLAYEQVLIVYDPRAEREHFIRETAFRAGSAHFGFVVPTPARPEVAKVEKSPFEALRANFSFQRFRDSGHGRLGGAGPNVMVLEVSKVGSFTAFVLAAKDDKALSQWLHDNGLVSTPEADAWLAHYVRMGFYYVAMRYDPPAEEDAGSAEAPLKAETIRISFSTPTPYYPYFEPKPPALPDGGDALPPRLLELWVASPARVTPVAARTDAGKTSWVRPMLEGARPADDGLDGSARKTLEDSLGDEIKKLLPPGALVVQTFQDQKASREGYGDVLFVPAEPAPVDPAKAKRLQPLLGVLDPALVPERGATP